VEHHPRRPRVSWLGRLLGLLVVTTAIVPIASGAHPAAPAVAAAPSPAALPSPGAAGIGDPYYPLMGNGGYDVAHYTLDLDLDVEAGSIRQGIATIEALATQSLSTFNLDYRGPTIAAIAVDDVPARWRREGGELTITPAAPLEVGDAFTVVVRYAGIPEGGDDRLTRGWWASGTAIATVGEPTGAEVWYPVNGHPLDKATYTLTITVLEPYDVVANGRLVSMAEATRAGDGPSARTFV
jgi:aminopeptidase N